MLHNKEYAQRMRVLLDENKYFCVDMIGQDLVLTNNSKSVTLVIDRSPLPENALYAKFVPNGHERYLQTKIRAKVRKHLDYLLSKVEKNVNDTVGYLTPLSESDLIN